jgi:hypothetical protein
VKSPFGNIFMEKLFDLATHIVNRCNKEDVLDRNGFDGTRDSWWLLWPRAPRPRIAEKSKAQSCVVAAKASRSNKARKVSAGPVQAHRVPQRAGSIAFNCMIMNCSSEMRFFTRPTPPVSEGGR